MSAYAYQEGRFVSSGLHLSRRRLTCNTHYRAGATPYPDGTFTRWNTPAFPGAPVSSSRPTFQSAPRAAPVKGGAEQPGATRSALQRAWRGLRAPDLDRREHGAMIVVGGNSMPRPTGSWFFPRPTSVLPQPGRRSWRGYEIATEGQGRASGLAGAARRTGRRCCRRIRTA